MKESTFNVINRESERRHATIVFADISGFTAMSEQVDAEDITSILNGCFDVMSDVIISHGGYVDKYIGDCVMAVFGVPVAVENAPLRALRCSIDLHECIANFCRKHPTPEPLSLHIGINSGPVIAGNVGSGDRRSYTVMGDTVNVASRLEDLANPDVTLVGPATFALTKHDFSFSAPASVELKGKAKPVQVYELLSRASSSYRTPERSNRSLSSELVGRCVELENLLSAFQQLPEHGGRILNVLGEAGIGKSRLLAEFRQRIGDDCLLLEAKAQSLGGNLSFHPIVELIEKWTEQKVGGGFRTDLNRIERLVEILCPGESAEIVPFLATMCGYELPPQFAARIDGIEGDKLARLIAVSMRNILAAAARRTPVVVVFEDVQWSDISSIDLFVGCFRLVANYPILYINTYRPGSEEASRRLTAATTDELPDRTSKIVLQPLGVSDSTQLIRNLVDTGNLPPKFLEQLLDRSGGNPYFLEEVFRSYIDSGTIVRKNESFIFAKDIDAIAPPSTIEEVIMTRIDILEDETKQLLRIASVIGRTVYDPILRCVASRIQDIDERLNHLVDLQILRIQQPENSGYVFKHALAQQAVYNSILLKTRRELHLSIGDSIEVFFAERLHEFYGMLAYHYSATDNREKAEEYLRKAGAQALKSSASSEALSFFKQALALYRDTGKTSRDSPTAAWLDRSIGTAYRNKGYHADAVKYFRRMLPTYGIHIPDGKFAAALAEIRFYWRIAVFISRRHPSRGRIPEERDVELIEILHDSAWSASMIRVFDTRFLAYAYITFGLSLDKPSTALAREAVGFCVMGLGMTGFSVSIGKRLIRIAQTHIDYQKPTERFMASFQFIGYELAVGDWTQEYDRTLVSHNLEFGQFQAVNCYLFWHGILRIEKGDLAGAKEIVQFSNSICDDYGNEEARLHSAMLNARYLEKIGDFPRALEYLDTAISVVEKIGLGTMRAWCLGTKLHIESIAGLLDDAKETYRKIGNIHAKRSDQTFARSAIITGELAFAIAGRREETKTVGEGLHALVPRAAKVAARWSLDRTEIYRMIGALFLLDGRKRKAAHWFEMAIRAGERLGAILELARAYRSASSVHHAYLAKAEEYTEKINSSSSGDVRVE